MLGKKIIVSNNKYLGALDQGINQKVSFVQSIYCKSRISDDMKRLYNGEVTIVLKILFSSQSSLKG